MRSILGRENVIDIKWVFLYLKKDWCVYEISKFYMHGILGLPGGVGKDGANGMHVSWRFSATFDCTFKIMERFKRWKIFIWVSVRHLIGTRNVSVRCRNYTPKNVGFKCRNFLRSMF